MICSDHDHAAPVLVRPTLAACVLTSAHTGRPCAWARRLRRPLFALLAVAALSFAAPNLAELLNEKLLQRVEREQGRAARQRVEQWRVLMTTGAGSNQWATLNTVNKFFNRQVAFSADADNWQRDDYWATPLEFLVRAKGDCEDYSIAKYFTLVALGVPKDRLRLMYVRALELEQAHMVLIYYETPEAIPLVLDNLRNDIVPADEREDLEPIYSFNGDGLWLAKAQGRGRQLRQDSGGQLWETLISRIEAGQ